MVFISCGIIYRLLRFLVCFLHISSRFSGPHCRSFERLEGKKQHFKTTWCHSVNTFGQVYISNACWFGRWHFVYSRLWPWFNPQNVLQLRQSARRTAPVTRGFQRGILPGGESPRTVSPGPPRVTSHRQNKSYAVVMVEKCGLDL